MDFIRQQHKFLRPKPQETTAQHPPNRQWIRSLRVGDSIETDRNETLVVVRGLCRNSPTKDCVLVKRQHRKIPTVLRSSETLDDCVELVWSQNDGWKQSEFKLWKVARPQLPQLPTVPSPSEERHASS